MNAANPICQGPHSLTGRDGSTMTNPICSVCKGRHKPSAPHSRGLLGLTARKVRPYVGKWIAVVDGRVLASGKDLAKVVAEGRAKSPDHEPTMVKVPTAELHLF